MDYGRRFNTKSRFAFKYLWFSKNEVERLKTTVENLFAPSTIIKCSIHKHPKGYRIYIWNQSMDFLRNNLHQYIFYIYLYIYKILQIKS